MKGRRIAILHDDPGSDSGRGPQGEECGDMTAAVQGAREALGTLGAVPLPVVIRRDDFGFVRELREVRPDLVLNFSDSFFGDSQHEPTLAGILEATEIPFTGTGPRGLALALDKGVAKAILTGHGIPTPAGRPVIPEELARATDLPLPAIVKPSAEDGSVGISPASVVRTRPALEDRVRYVWESYNQPALVEEYIGGREITVAIWGNGEALRSLPPSEIDFSELPEELPPIVTLDAKWKEGSPEYEGTRPVAPAHLAPPLQGRLHRIAVDAFRAFHLRDFGRVDFRVGPGENPFVIDVNPNPDISPDAGFPRSSAAAGYSYAETIGEICRLAMERYARR